MKCLIVKKYWLDKIFDEGKIWEMRSTKTKVRGKIGLIESGSGLIVGEVNINGCSRETISEDPMLIQFHKVEDLSLLEKWKYAWFLDSAKRYNEPIPYKHPKGAVIWVNAKETAINNEYYANMIFGHYHLTYVNNNDIEEVYNLTRNFINQMFT